MEKEYVILYTHQKQKKAKTWHDGTLKVGSLGNKAVLYDDKGCKLDSIYIKSGAIAVGEQLESDRYYIQVEELKSTSPPTNGENQSTSNGTSCEYPWSVSSSQTRCAALKRKKTGFVPPRMFKQARHDPMDTEPEQSSYNRLGESAGQLAVDISQNSQPLSGYSATARNDVLKFYSTFAPAGSQTSSQGFEDSGTNFTSQDKMNNSERNPGAKLLGCIQKQSPNNVRCSPNSDIKSPWSVYGSNNSSPPALSVHNLVTNVKNHVNPFNSENDVFEQERKYNYLLQNNAVEQYEDKNTYVNPSSKRSFPAGQDVSELDIGSHENECIGSDNVCKNATSVNSSIDSKEYNVPKQKRNVNEIMSLLRGRSNVAHGCNEKSVDNNNEHSHDVFVKDHLNESSEKHDTYTGYSNNINKEVGLNKSENSHSKSSVLLESKTINQNHRFQNFFLEQKHDLDKSEKCDFGNNKEVVNPLSENNTSKENLIKDSVLNSCPVVDLKSSERMDVTNISKCSATYEFSDDETCEAQASFAISYSPLSHVTDSEDDIEIGIEEHDSQLNGNSVHKLTNDVHTIQTNEEHPSKLNNGKETDNSLSHSDFGCRNKTLEQTRDAGSNAEVREIVCGASTPLSSAAESISVSQYPYSPRNPINGGDKSKLKEVEMGMDKGSNNEKECMDNDSCTLLQAGNTPGDCSEVEKVTSYMKQDNGDFIPELSCFHENDETYDKTNDILYQIGDKLALPETKLSDCNDTPINSNENALHLEKRYEMDKKIIASGKALRNEFDSMKTYATFRLLDMQIMDTNSENQITETSIPKQEIECVDVKHKNRFTRKEIVRDILDVVNEDVNCVGDLEHKICDTNGDMNVETKTKYEGNEELTEFMNSESTYCKTTQSQDTMEFSCDTFDGDSQQLTAYQLSNTNMLSNVMGDSSVISFEKNQPLPKCLSSASYAEKSLSGAANTSSKQHSDVVHNKPVYSDLDSFPTDSIGFKKKHFIEDCEHNACDMAIQNHIFDSNCINNVEHPKHYGVPVSQVQTKKFKHQQYFGKTVENFNENNLPFGKNQFENDNIHTKENSDEIPSQGRSLLRLQPDNLIEAVNTYEDSFQRLPDSPVDPAPHPAKLFGRGVRNKLRQLAVADAGIPEEQNVPDSQVMPSGRLTHNVNARLDGYRMLGGVCGSAVRELRSNATCDTNINRHEDNMNRKHAAAPCFTVPQLSDSDGDMSVGSSPSFYVDWCNGKPQFLHKFRDRQMAATLPDCSVPEIRPRPRPRCVYQSPTDSCGSDSLAVPLPLPCTVPSIPDINKDEDDEIYQHLYKARLLYPRPTPPPDNGPNCGIVNDDSSTDVAESDCRDQVVSSQDSFHYSKPKPSSSLQQYRHRQRTVMKSKPFDDKITHSSYQTYHFSPSKTSHKEKVNAYPSIVPSVHDSDGVKIQTDSFSEPESQSQDLFMCSSPNVDRISRHVDNYMSKLNKESVDTSHRVMTWNVDSPLLGSDSQNTDAGFGSLELANTKPGIENQESRETSQPAANINSRWSEERSQPAANINSRWSEERSQPAANINSRWSEERSQPAANINSRWSEERSQPAANINSRWSEERSQPAANINSRWSEERSQPAANINSRWSEERSQPAANINSRWSEERSQPAANINSRWSEERSQPAANINSRWSEETSQPAANINSRSEETSQPAANINSRSEETSQPAANINSRSEETSQPAANINSRWSEERSQPAANINSRWSEERSQPAANINSRWYEETSQPAANINSRSEETSQPAANINSRWSEERSQPAANINSRWSEERSQPAANINSRWSEETSQPAANINSRSEETSQPAANINSRWGKYIPDSSPEDMDITAFTQRQGTRVSDFSVIENSASRIQTVTDSDKPAGPESPVCATTVKSSTFLSQCKPKSQSPKIQNSFSSTDSFEEMLANHVFSGETVLTPNCGRKLPETNTRVGEHGQQNVEVDFHDKRIGISVNVQSESNSIHEMETLVQEPDSHVNKEIEMNTPSQNQVSIAATVSKSVTDSHATEHRSEGKSQETKSSFDVCKNSSSCSHPMKSSIHESATCEGITRVGQSSENSDMLRKSQETSTKSDECNAPSESVSVPGTECIQMDNVSSLVSPVVTRSQAGSSQDSNFMGYDSDDPDELHMLENDSRRVISSNNLGKTSSPMTFKKTIKSPLTGPNIIPMQTLCSYSNSRENCTSGMNSQIPAKRVQTSGRFRSPLQSPDITQTSMSVSPGVTAQAASTGVRRAFKPPVTFFRSPGSSPSGRDVTGDTVITQANHQDSSGGSEWKIAPCPVISTAAMAVERKGFRPLTQVQAPTVTTCSTPLPPSSKLQTTTPSIFSGELRFPSRLEIDRCRAPLRQATISVTFSSVAEYKHALTAALREYVNLQLFDVAERYHHALAKVDYSGYSTGTNEKPGGVSTNPNPVCQCGAPSKMVCVRKEGPNNGRFFYTCNAARHQQCKFFQWADEKCRGGHSGGSKQKLSDPQSLNSYMKMQHVHCYCQCHLVKRSKENIMPYFKAPKWARGRGEGTVLQKKQIFLRLPYKGHSSLYTKDDLWIVSQHLDFDPGSTFIARSVYYGPTSSSEVEIEPLTGYSPSNWQNEAVCHALLAGNASSELTCLENIREHIQAQFPPIIPHLLNRPDGKMVTGGGSRGGFQAPQSVSGTTTSRNVHLHSAQLDELARDYIGQYKLNEDQSEALHRVANMFSVEKSHTVDSVLLIHGVFGAGKSFLLSVIVLFLVQVFQMNNSESPGQPFPWKLLISSTTNVAVDRILMGLLQLGFEDFVRVGSVKKIAKPVLPFSVHASGTDSQELKDHQEMLRSGELTAGEKHHVRQSIEKHRQGENKQRLRRVRVVGVTCASCSLSCLSGIQFPLVLLDECSQMTEPASLLPIARFACQKLLLVGDPKQLDPTIQRADAAHNSGLEQTMFDRLVKMGYVPTLLRTQYRCHPGISSAANALFYGGMLEDGITDADRPPVLDELPTICFYDVVTGQECCERAGSYYNESEASFVVFLIETLIACDVQPTAIGVITLYRSQMARINDMLTDVSGDDQEAKGVQVSTVDAFQGGERDVVILSCVRTRGCGFIDNDKRTNVALTRARNHLLIVGNRHNLSANLLWGKVIRHCQGFPNGMQSADEAKDKLQHCRESMKLSGSKGANSNSTDSQNSQSLNQCTKPRQANSKTKKRKSTVSETVNPAGDQEESDNRKSKKRKTPPTQKVQMLGKQDENVDFVVQKDDSNTKYSRKVQKRRVSNTEKQKDPLTEQRNIDFLGDCNRQMASSDITEDLHYNSDYPGYTEIDDSPPMSLSASADDQNVNMSTPHDAPIHEDSGDFDFDSPDNKSHAQSSNITGDTAVKIRSKPRFSDRLRLDMFESTEHSLSDDLPAFDL